MKRCFVGVVLMMSALYSMDPITRNPFAPANLVDNELVATAYIQASHTTINFMTRGKKIMAVSSTRGIQARDFGGKKPLQLYTS